MNRLWRHLSVSRKLTVILAFGLGVYAVTVIFLHQYFVFPGFLAVEREHAQREMRRCTIALIKELEALGAYCANWATWQDAYDFAADQDPEFVQTNLVDSTFTKNNLSLIYLLDMQGQVLYGEFFDLATEQPMLLSEFPREQWAVSHPLLRHEHDRSQITGLMSTSKGPMMISSRPLIPPGASEGWRGYIILGRLLSQEIQLEMRERVQVPFLVGRPTTASQTPSRLPRSEIWPVDVSGDVQIEDRNPDVLVLRMPLFDINGHPAFEMVVELNRDIRARGVLAVNTYAFAAGGVAFLIFVLIMWVIQQAVVFPLALFTRHVTRIRTSNQLDELQEERRTDEIGQLMRAFNHLIRDLRQDREDLLLAHEVLKAGEAKLSMILDSAPDGLFTVTPEGVIETYSNSAAEIFGCGVHELVGLKVSQLFSPEHRPFVDSEIVRLMGDSGRAAEVVEREVPGLRRDGSTLPLHLRMRAFQPDDRRMLTLSVRDISEIKEMHARILENKHLAALGEIGAGIAHEIRNPLAGLHGAVQILRNPKQRESVPEEVFDEIVALVERIERTVTRLLEFAKHWNPQVRSCSLQMLLHDFQQEIAGAPEFDNVSVEMGDVDGLSICADAFLTQQVLRNIAQNAAESAKGPCTIRWSGERHKDGVRLLLCDNGQGMSPDVLLRVFEPFFTTRAKGTGLGLSICKRIMEAQHGAISITSVPGKGTCVALHFEEGDDR